jgi:hypothetical protein
MPQTLFQLYRVIGTMQVSGNNPGVGQSINFSFDLYYGNAQQNNGIPEIVGKPIVTHSVLLESSQYKEPALR